MRTFLNMGEAVHAVLPYIATGGDPLACTLSQLEDHLRSVHPFNRFEHELERGFLQRILACWQVVGHYIQPALKTFCEPDFLGAKRIDLAVEFDGRVDVVELKTSPRGKRNFKGQRLLAKGHAQVNAVLPGARRHWPAHKVDGFLLHFNNSVHEPLKPLWQATAAFRPWR